MNKKAAISSDILMNNVTYLIFLIIFFVSMLAFVRTVMNGASTWEDFYAKEIVKVINAAKPGDAITLDARSATQIASKNKVNHKDVFSFDNAKNEVCVRLTGSRKSCFNFYNEVDVNNSQVKLLDPVNVLKFEIVESGRGAP